MMNKAVYGIAAVMLTSCAVGPEQTTLSQAELSDCLQPNRRVVIDVVGQTLKPPAKKPAAPPQAAATDKPAPKPEAAAAPKPEAAAAPKPAKPEFVAFQEMTYVQGNSAFDPGSAVLKDAGKAEIDQLVATLKKRAVQIGAVIISGHTDRLEARGAQAQTLSEARATAVKDYLVSKGIDQKLMFWEGKEAKEPVPVTKFCT
jgi:OmpA-OmpF porin, OOP family